MSDVVGLRQHAAALRRAACLLEQQAIDLEGGGAPPRTDAEFVRQFAANLRALRLAAGMSLKDLAAASGLSPATVGSYERPGPTGRVAPMSALGLLARALGVSVADLAAEGTAHAVRPAVPSITGVPVVVNGLPLVWGQTTSWKKIVQHTFGDRAQALKAEHVLVEVWYPLHEYPADIAPDALNVWLSPGTVVNCRELS